MIKVTCNEGCNEEFILISLGTEQLKEDIERVGFSCPHCGKVYISHYTNDEIKELKDKLSKLLKKSRKRNISNYLIGKYQKQVDNIQVQIKTTSDNLRKEIEAS